MKYYITYKIVKTNSENSNKFDNYEFVYFFDSKKAVLICIKGLILHKDGRLEPFDLIANGNTVNTDKNLGPSLTSLLDFYIKKIIRHLPSEIDYKEIEKFVIKNRRKVSGLISELNYSFKERAFEIKKKIETKDYKKELNAIPYDFDVLNNSDTKNKSKTHFNAKVESLPDDFDLNERIKAQNSEQYVLSVPNPKLFEKLIKEEVTPIIKDSIYSINDKFLPFFKIEGTIKMPLIINEEFSAYKNNLSKDESLRQHRQNMGAKLYNGHNLQVRKFKIKNHQITLEISKTGYFDILDSADWLPFQMKLCYGKLNNLNENDKEYDKVKYKLNELKRIWRTRCESIINGNFTNFNPGLAFSMPIFQIVKNSNLRVLSAKGSENKAAGNGQRHIAPAGMFEYWSHEDFKAKFQFEDFIVLAAKELLEETVFSNSSLSVDKDYDFHECLKYFINEEVQKQGVSYTILRNHIDTIRAHWQEIWEYLSDKYPILNNKDINNQLNEEFKKSVPNAAALDELLKIDNEYFYQNAHFVVDALTLRPEIIMPLYIKEELNNIVNWEYDSSSVEILEFTDMNDLNNKVLAHHNNYCAPGIAAIYLGAKSYFESLNKYS